MADIKRICVYCGSSTGAKSEYTEIAIELGRLLAAENISLIYGGGNSGVMGRIADAALEASGHVIGVIPQALMELEVAHHHISDLRVVDSMHERKALMAELSDAFIALPGGFGTLEEIFEVLTWTQLDMQQKPCGLLNVRGYYDVLLEFLRHAVKERFLQPEHLAMLLVETDPLQLLIQLRAYEHKSVSKWVDR